MRPAGLVGLDLAVQRLPSIGGAPRPGRGDVRAGRLLLQTPGYTRAVTLASRPDLSADELTRTTEVRQARQDRLPGENAPAVHAILGEGVLRRVVGGREVMIEQLKRIVTLADSDNVTVQVLPFEAGAHPGMVSPFHILKFPEDAPPAVYLENDRGAVYLERPGDVERYTWMHDALTQHSLSRDRTAELAFERDTSGG